MRPRVSSRRGGVYTRSLAPCRGLRRAFCKVLFTALDPTVGAGNPIDQPAARARDPGAQGWAADHQNGQAEGQHPDAEDRKKGEDATGHKREPQGQTHPQGGFSDFSVPSVRWGHMEGDGATQGRGKPSPIQLPLNCHPRPHHTSSHLVSGATPGDAQIAVDRDGYQQPQRDHHRQHGRAAIRDQR